MPHSLTTRLRQTVCKALLLGAADLLLAQGAAAQSRFDLTGPDISVHVQRGSQSLPIALVPNLQAGDKLTIQADLPKSQSVHLILVVVFLRGSTNPPPEDWFTEIKTWDKKVSEGFSVKVPQEAQQALVFLAPETSGDFSTLKSAVRGRPGLFVRAAQDLNEASFEQARIERYVQALKRVPAGSPEQLLDHSKKLAATLNLKPNDDCFKKPADQQLACLRQSGTQLLLDDGHGQTLASTLTSGDSANLIGAVAGTPMANQGGAALYSAYVGTVIDVVRLMSGIHTAHFQYIPAVAFPNDEQLNLRLNTPPSFHDPKSVIVVALPAIQNSVAPPLRLQDANHVSCLLQPKMVLPLEGAPLVFATSFGHDLVLHLNNGATLNGKTDLPLVADAFEGGLVLSDEPNRRPLPTSAPEARDSADNPTGMRASEANRTRQDSPEVPEAQAIPTIQADTGGQLQVTGTLRGMWGFDAFSGVTVPLQRLPGSAWTAAEQSELFAGRANQFRIHADGTACTASVALDQGGNDTPLQWKQSDRPNALDVSLPLEKAAPGSLRLLVHQYGTPAISKVAVTAYSDKTRLEAVHIHAGDNFASLSGAGLGGVVSLKIAGRDYKPTDDQPSDGRTLRFAHEDDGKPAAATSKSKPSLASAGERGMAEATLSDGRAIPVSYTVDAARPSLNLLNRTVKPDDITGIPLTLTGKDDLPLNAKITLAVRSQFPARFPRMEKIEVALTDGSLKTMLSLADGSIILQDSRTALAFFTPAKTFGPSAFGPVQVRAVADDGTTGDWIPLGTLVRTPVVTGITCTHTPVHEDAGTPPCQITGKDLFLVDSFSADSSFEAPSEVPLGFAGESLPVPRPADNRTLYLKLRDNPEVVDTLTATSLTGGVRRSPAQIPTSGYPPAPLQQPPAPSPQTGTDNAIHGARSLSRGAAAIDTPPQTKPTASASAGSATNFR